ncbi:MAG: hypothetical protein M1827_005163 [Pycnora praestabilis]|nr:MAG: hypothetical protein M1827_005163 [Pycnora praestabilis]
MTTSTAYKPLETLLLFQCLAKHGIDPTGFMKISDLLTSNPLIRDAKTFDSNRFSPNALRELYERLLADEILSEGSNSGTDHSGADSNGQPLSRKRKLPSPQLASVQDASQNLHLLPQLVARLYARYRDTVIQEIREDERRYETLRREINEIERGERDHEIRERKSPSAKVVSSKASSGTQRDDEGSQEARPVEELRGPLDESERDSRPVPARSPGIGVLLNDPISTVIASSVLEPDTSATLARTPLSTSTSQIRGSNPERIVPAPGIPQVDSSGLATAESKTPNYSRHYPFAPTSSHRNQVSQASPTPRNGSTPYTQPHDVRTSSTTPHLPPPQHSSHGYRLASPSAGVTNGPASQAASQTSQSHQQGYIDFARNPNGPPQNQAYPGRPLLSFPPPAVPTPASDQSAGPLDALADMASKQHRTSTGPSPSQQLRPLPSPQHHSTSSAPLSGIINSNQGSPQLSQPQQPYNPNTYPYPGRQPAYAGSQNMLGQPTIAPYYRPGQGDVALPPFPASPYYFQQQQQQGSLPPHMRSQTNLGSPNIPAANQSPPQTMRSANFQILVGTPSSNRRSSQLPPLDTSTSSTRWKPIEQDSIARSPGSPIPPRDAISPISDKEPSPVPKATRASMKSPRAQKGRPKKTMPAPETPTEKATDDLQPNTDSPKTRRKKTPSTSGLKSKRIRASSTASSVVANSTSGRTRSQSILSHADELSLDNESVRKIKYEQPSTPAGIPVDEYVETADNTADESSRASTRAQRNVLKRLDQGKPKSKRKRSVQETPNASEAMGIDIEIPNSFPSRTHQVLATRNFTRISATIMNDITAHKHASLFANFVKEKDAPGYKDLIYRPQDLKSIKSAIAAGGRAVSATAGQASTPAEVGTASPGPGSAGTPSKYSSSWILASSDVVPPKGIINSAQLEKELMRMFANAVMFNPDPDRGVGPAFEERDREVQGDKGDEPLGPANNEEEEGGVIKDTREMFENVEKSVAHWRAAERPAEEISGAGKLAGGKGNSAASVGRDRDEDEVDELAGDGAEDQGPGQDEEDEEEVPEEVEEVASIAKRRRRG